MPEITAELDSPEWWAQMAELRDSLVASLECLAEDYAWAEEIAAWPYWAWPCLLRGHRPLFLRTIKRVGALSDKTDDLRSILLKPMAVIRAMAAGVGPR